MNPEPIFRIRLINNCLLHLSLRPLSLSLHQRRVLVPGNKKTISGETRVILGEDGERLRKLSAFDTLLSLGWIRVKKSMSTGNSLPLHSIRPEIRIPVGSQLPPNNYSRLNSL
jgi:hypothetical protein